MLQVNEWNAAVNRFLISQSAKDCSLIIASASVAQKDALDTDNAGVDGMRRVLVCATGREVVYRCAVVDLDRKERNKIESYYERDKELVQTFLEAQRAGNKEIKQELCPDELCVA